MRFRIFFSITFVFLALIYKPTMAFSYQEEGIDSVALELRLLQEKYRQDSINELFSSAYSAIIYDNPNRESFLGHRLKNLSKELVPPTFLFWDEFRVAKQQVYAEAGVLKQTRPLWVLITVAILILCIGLIRLLFPTEFKVIIEAYYRDRLLQKVSKEDNIATSWPYVFLYAIFCFILALFILIVVSEFLDKAILNPLNYIKITGIIAALFLMKIVLIRFLSFVFEVNRMVKEYIAVLYLVYFNTMLLLTPFLLFVVLCPTVYFNFLLIIFSLLSSIALLYRLLTTFVYMFNNTKFSISYLIIYLCTLEIAPILLLIRALGN